MIFKKFHKINSNFCENIFLHKVVDILHKHLDDNYNLILTNNEDIDLLDFNDKCINIVIFISDEEGIIPVWVNKVDFIFRTYGNNDICDYKKIFPIPCGFVGPFKIDGLDNTYLGELEKTPLTQREYDLFYSGQKALNRIIFMFFVNRIKNKFNSFINQTIGFRKGLSIQKYFSIMNNSKIALVPRGAVIPESFRYMEAFESNCIVITSYPRHLSKYNMWYYENSPAVFIKNWWSLKPRLIDKLLSKENLELSFEKNKKYYDEYLSTKAVADYIINNLK